MGERARKTERVIVEDVHEWFCDICGRVAPGDTIPDDGTVRTISRTNLAGWSGLGTRRFDRPAHYDSESIIDLCPDCNQRVRAAVAEMRKAKGLKVEF